ncbi:hypothetical protein MsAg5_07510 [Methanosarcinaceae archaeon Ag5]|uniref:Uncharacterized protein n=1 Tax=Methanolapillus africanus TaxID=3028297 RepID=A0AAE4SDS3_9EURY|nr:hypothetical protein [Methanosarcinaceae archaeon Ag5]
MSATESSEIMLTPFQFQECTNVSQTFEQMSGKIKLTEDDEFFRGLVERARYYEQFEDRKSKITYSSINVQSEIGVY